MIAIFGESEKSSVGDVPEIGIESVVDNVGHDLLRRHVDVEELIPINIGTIWARSFGTIDHDNPLIIEPHCVKAIDVLRAFHDNLSLNNRQGIDSSHLSPLNSGSPISLGQDDKRLAPCIIHGLKMEIPKTLEWIITGGNFFELLAQVNKGRSVSREFKLQVEASK